MPSVALEPTSSAEIKRAERKLAKKAEYQSRAGEVIIALSDVFAAASTENPSLLKSSGFNKACKMLMECIADRDNCFATSEFLKLNEKWDSFQWRNFLLVAVESEFKHIRPDEESFVEYAEILLLNNEPKQAKEIALKGLKKFKNKDSEFVSELHYILAKAHIELDEIDEAAQAVTKAYTIEIHNADLPIGATETAIGRKILSLCKTIRSIRESTPSNEPDMSHKLLH